MRSKCFQASTSLGVREIDVGRPGQLLKFCELRVGQGRSAKAVVSISARVFGVVRGVDIDPCYDTLNALFIQLHLSIDLRIAMSFKQDLCQATGMRTPRFGWQHLKRSGPHDRDVFLASQLDIRRVEDQAKITGKVQLRACLLASVMAADTVFVPHRLHFGQVAEVPRGTVPWLKLARPALHGQW